MSHRICFKIHWFSQIFFCLAFIIGCDQASKAIAKATLSHSGSLSYWGDFLRLQYMENPGAFLGLGANLPSQHRFWIFSVVASLCLIGAAFFILLKRFNPFYTLGLALIVGGGTGNLIDRLTFGYVIDFINIGIGNFRTGIFNVADIAIVAGVGLLFLEELSPHFATRTPD